MGKYEYIVFMLFTLSFDGSCGTLNAKFVSTLQGLAASPYGAVMNSNDITDPAVDRRKLGPVSVMASIRCEN